MSLDTAWWVQRELKDDGRFAGYQCLRHVVRVAALARVVEHPHQSKKKKTYCSCDL